MPWLALGLLSAFLIIVFPLRAIRRRSRFGDIDPVDRRRPRPRAWKIADALFLVGFTFSLAGLALQGAGVLAAVFVPSSMLQVFAVALTVVATTLAIWAQETMGLAWHADIAPAERCEIVTSGPFALARNPTYVAMATAIAGTLLLAPNGCNVGGWLLVLAGLQATARAEEPLLAAAYGRSYRDYAARVGRFLPSTGRLRG